MHAHTYMHTHGHGHQGLEHMAIRGSKVWSMGISCTRVWSRGTRVWSRGTRVWSMGIRGTGVRGRFVRDPRVWSMDIRDTGVRGMGIRGTRVRVRFTGVFSNIYLFVRF